MTDVTRERLIEDLKVVIRDAEELLRATADQAGEKIAEVRARAQASLQNAKVRLGELGQQARDQARVAAGSADEYVHANPWTAVGIAAVAGLLVGLCLGRHGDD